MFLNSICISDAQAQKSQNRPSEYSQMRYGEQFSIYKIMQGFLMNFQAF